MGRVVNFILLLSILLTCNSKIVFADNIKIAVISDIHFLSQKIATPGPALSAYESITGRNIKDLHSILNKVLNEILKEGIDVLLISGDLTNHGELQSHTDLIEYLKPLNKSGIQIFITPGNHDINIPNSKQYTADETISTASVSVDEFRKLYDTFGLGSAIYSDESSLSYVAEITKNLWLLSIDSNRYDENMGSSISGGRIKDETMLWALNILQKAKERKIRIVGMMHHGLIEHMPYQSAFFPDYLIEDWKNQADILADAGLEIIFTGHFHSNDITLSKSPSGNIIYDIETASLSQYPFAYRIINLLDSTLSIESRFITSTPQKPDLDLEYKLKLERITRRAADNRLNNLGVPMSSNIKDVLTDMIVKLYLAHVKGDEVPDSEMLEMIESFSALLGNEVQEEDYSFDFPPEDNNLTLELKPLNH